MNYIQSLQQENQSLKAEKEQVNEQIAELMAYINSPKFQCGDELDGYVNISDIVGRLVNIRSSMN